MVNWTVYILDSRGTLFINELKIDWLLRNTCVIFVNHCFFSSSESRCLEDRPMTKQAINVQLFKDPGLLYNADQQCALSYGEGAKYCKDKSPEV